LRLLARVQSGEHLVLDHLAGASELIDGRPTLSGDSDDVSPAVVWVAAAFEQSALVQRVDDRNSVARVDADDLAQAPLMTLADLSERHQHPELMGRKPPRSEHSGPKTPRLGAQTGEEVAAAESELGELERVGWRPEVG